MPETPESKLFAFLATRMDIVGSLIDRLPLEIFSEEGREIVRNRAFPYNGSSVSECEALAFLKSQLLALLGREVGRAQRKGNATSRIREIMQIIEECELGFEPLPIETFRDIEPAPREYIPTGIAPLDEQIIGIAKGDLGILACPSGRGKSCLLINIAVAALFNEKSVLYITVADQGKDEITPRIDSCILEEPVPTNHSAETLVTFHKKAVARIPSSFWLADFTDRTCSLDSVERSIVETKPDIVIVDHADDVQSPSSDDLTVSRHSLRVVYMHLKKLATKYDVGIWTASQTHEQSWHLPALGIDGLAEAKTGKATGSAIVIVLTGGPSEIHGTMYATIAKARRIIRKRVVTIRYDHAITRCW